MGNTTIKLGKETKGTSALSEFSLAFEYDVSWNDARKASKSRAT